MWLTERLAPDFKIIADFRKNGKGIKQCCRRFIDLCRQMNMFSDALIAIDGSKFKASNNKIYRNHNCSVKIYRVCSLQTQCTKTATPRTIRRWEHASRIEKMTVLLESKPDSMVIRQQTVEHSFGTIKLWIGQYRYSPEHLRVSALKWTCMSWPTISDE